MAAKHSGDAEPARTGSVLAPLLLIMAVVVVAYLVTGIAMRRGRALHGVMESFVITGALSWSVALVGRENTGTVMPWVGTALYTAYAIGAPAGSLLYGGYGFAAVGLATIVAESSRQLH